MNDRSWTAALARHVGILPRYRDATGGLHATSHDTRVALLAALGLDAASEAAARAALEDLRRRESSQFLEPVRVAVVADRGPLTIPLNSAGRESAKNERIEIVEEGGRVHRWDRGTRGRKSFETNFQVELPIGYHRLNLTRSADRSEQHAEQRLIVVPAKCPDVRTRLANRPGFGLCANLYSVQSGRNWGVGDLTDLAALCRWAGTVGASFVGVNPLHALFNREPDVGPYSPVSRMYRSVAYVDVAAIPEVADCPTVRDRLQTPEFVRRVVTLRGTAHIDYQRITELKLELLHQLHEAFARRHLGAKTPRGRAYADFLTREGVHLWRFATFMALDQHFLKRGAAHESWHDWPKDYQNPHSPVVEDFQSRHRAEIHLQCFIQFVLDEQLAAAALTARQGGMSLGLYQDLAIGVSRKSADLWGHRELFVSQAGLGAPPDAYAPQGQDWELPPLNPMVLRQSGYEYWIRVLRATLRHTGLLRIDHVMGLARQFWIPAGRPASQGAYVEFPWDDLAGIVALESTRHNAAVIGEDLGTLPPGFAKKLAGRGMLSMRVLFFERDRKGGFRPATKYSSRALVSATTHDFGPFLGYWKGADLALRKRVGLLFGREQWAKSLKDRSRDRKRLLARLRAEGVLDARKRSPEDDELLIAIHAFLAKTPSPLVGVMLDDLSGETEPVNLPGVKPEVFRGWCRRMKQSLEELRADPKVGRILARFGSPP